MKKWIFTYLLFVATAFALASELIQKYPKFASPIFTLGKIEVQRQNWADALQYDRKSYELSGDALVLPHIVAELHQLGPFNINISHRAIQGCNFHKGFINTF